MQISQENTCVGVFFNKIADPQNCNFIENRLHHKFFSCEFFKLFKSTYFVEDLGTRGSEKRVYLFKNTFLLQNISSDCFLQFQVSGPQIC